MRKGGQFSSVPLHHTISDIAFAYFIKDNVWFNGVLFLLYILKINENRRDLRGQDLLFLYAEGKKYSNGCFMNSDWVDIFKGGGRGGAFFFLGNNALYMHITDITRKKYIISLLKKCSKY